MSNKALVHQSLIVLSAVSGGVLLVILATYFGLKAAAGRRLCPLNAVKGRDYPDLGHIALISTMTFIGVVITEFVFTLAIAKKYLPLDPNAVKAQMMAQTIANIKSLTATPP